jgi:hypothetical protein
MKNETLGVSRGIQGNLSSGTIAGFLALIGIIAAILAKLFTFTPSLMTQQVIDFIFVSHVKLWHNLGMRTADALSVGIQTQWNWQNFFLRKELQAIRIPGLQMLKLLKLRRDYC